MPSHLRVPSISRIAAAVVSCASSLLRESNTHTHTHTLNTDKTHAAYGQGQTWYRQLCLDKSKSNKSSSSSSSGSHSKHESQQQVPLNVMEYGLAGGGVSGAISACLFSPVELIKSRLQVQYGSSSSKAARMYNGALDCLVKTVRRDGLRRGLFCGLEATMWRDVPGSMFWYGTYEYLRIWTSQRGWRPPSVWARVDPLDTAAGSSLLSLAFSGFFAGAAYWTAVYPFDVVKSRTQTELTRQFLASLESSTAPAPAAPAAAAAARVPPVKLASMHTLSAVRHIYRTEGMRALWKGYTVAVATAAPASAVILVTYHLIYDQLTQIQDTDDDM
jgi:solute carrier family 25 carnitine/acylcarnitine transporter 20/29